jgi:hypothetical protein
MTNIKRAPDMSHMKYSVSNIVGEQVELVPGGTNLAVPAKERHMYCQLAKEFRVNELNSFFNKMTEWFSIFLNNIGAFMVTPDKLKSVICGSGDIPIHGLKQLMQMSNATIAEIKQLYECLRSSALKNGCCLSNLRWARCGCMLQIQVRIVV